MKLEREALPPTPSLLAFVSVPPWMVPFALGHRIACAWAVGWLEAASDGEAAEGCGICGQVGWWPLAGTPTNAEGERFEGMVCPVGCLALAAFLGHTTVVADALGANETVSMLLRR